MWRLGLDGFQLIRFRVGVQECGLIEGGRRRFVVNPAPAVPGHLASHLARCLFHDSVAQAPSPTCSPAETFAAVAATIRRAAGLTTEAPQVPWAAERPRLTEAWFCCAEPTASQLGALCPATPGSDA